MLLTRYNNRCWLKALQTGGAPLQWTSIYANLFFLYHIFIWQTTNYYYYHYYCIMAPWTLSGTTQMSQKCKTMKVKPIWIYWSKRQWVAVASVGPYANMHLAQIDKHVSIPPLSFLQAGCPSCCPTNSVKALKAKQLNTRKLKTWLSYITDENEQESALQKRCSHIT